MCEEVPQPPHCYVQGLRAAVETPVSRAIIPLVLNLTYLNIQIIVCVKAYPNPKIATCRQSKSQRPPLPSL